MPAAADPELAAKIAAQTVSIYEDQVAVMLDKVSKRLAKGINEPGWAEEKLADTIRMRDDAQRVVNTLSGKIPKSVLAGLTEASEAGIKLAGVELGGGFFRGNRGAMEALVKETVGGLQQANGFILRSVMDEYRRIATNPVAGIVAGVETRRTATAKMLDQFATAGIKGFRDKAGRQWAIDSYAEMTMRTAAGRAHVDGALARYQSAGSDLVIVSNAPEECPICRPWERKVLSITGATVGELDRGVHVAGTVAEARAAGLQHGNCRHSLSRYVPGLTNIDIKNTEDPEGDKLRRQQRHLERNVRTLRRRVVTQKSYLEGLAKEPGGIDSASAKSLQKLQLREREATDNLNKFIDDNDRKNLAYRTSVPGFKAHRPKITPEPKAPKPPAPKIEVGPLGAPKNLPPLKPVAPKPAPVPTPAKPKPGPPSSSTKVLGRSPLGKAVLDKLKPVQTYSGTAAKKRETDIRKLPGGNALMNVVQDFQSGGTANTRKKVEAYLAGKKQPATHKHEVEALLDAIEQSPREIIPPKLYRGMSIPGTPKDVAAGVQAGRVLDFNVSGFSSSRNVSAGFSKSRKGETSIMIIWDEDLQAPGYNARKALPIQNTSSIKTYFDEKEWLAGGRFFINKMTQSGDRVTLHVSQIRGIE